jgi:flagellar motor switch protein FliM
VTHPSATPARSSGRPSRRAKNIAPQPYDFRRPTKLSREHTRALEVAYETFARQWATLLTSTLRVVATIGFASIQQHTYDEYISSLQTPTVLVKTTLDPLPGTALFEHSLSVAMACVDHMLGGAGGTQPERQLTEIEHVLIRGMHERAMSELRYAFESIVTLEPRLGSIEYNPQFAQAAAPSDAVVVAYFDMKVGTEECVATICLPYASILPMLQESDDVELTDAERVAKEHTLEKVTAGLEATPIDVAVRFQPVKMRPSDILSLAPGDIVPLGHPVNQPLTVSSADITFAHAVPGNHGSRLACLVVPAPKENPRA